MKAVHNVHGFGVADDCYSEFGGAGFQTLVFGRFIVTFSQPPQYFIFRFGYRLGYQRIGDGGSGGAVIYIYYSSISNASINNPRQFAGLIVDSIVSILDLNREV